MVKDSPTFYAARRRRSPILLVGCACWLATTPAAHAQHPGDAQAAAPHAPAPTQVSDARADGTDFSPGVIGAEPQQNVGSVPPVGELAEDAGSISVSRSGTVEMHVANLRLATVLEALSIQGHRNIIATPNVTGTVTAHLFDVTFTEALTAILASNGASFQEKDGFIYVYTNEELAGILADETPPVTRVFTLAFCSSTDALAVISPMLSQGGSAVAAPEAVRGLSTQTSSSSGGASSSLTGAANGTGMAQRDYLAVRDRPEVLEEIEKTLRELDVPPKQVQVEATILAVTLNDDNALGVDFTVVGGVDLELLGAMSNAVTDLSLGKLPTDQLDHLNSNVTTDFSGSVPKGGVTLGVIKDRVGVFVRALEEITDTVVLANPKVLALNRQQGQVIIGRRDGFLTTTVTETQAIQNVEYLETGTQLVFRPFIGDNGLVRMELHPEDSVGTVTNGLPSEQTTEVTTDVVLRDGQTVLIGGLFREVTANTRSQIPLLGNAPIVGPLFQGRRDTTIRQEVIILLTVHIVDNEKTLAGAGEKARQDAERIRVGIRRAMMWHGRERQAQIHYRKSLAHLADGETDEALWDLRAALQNNPTLLPAIELREKLRRQREWDEDGAATRDFIRRLIADEPATTALDFDRPALEFPDAPPANQSQDGQMHEGQMQKGQMQEGEPNDAP